MAKSPSVALSPEAEQNLAIYKLILADLARLKETELQYRLALEKQIAFDPNKTEGSQTVTLPTGEKMKLDRPMNRSVASDPATVHNAMFRLQQINPAMAATVVVQKFVLNESEYKKVPEGSPEALILAEIITAKPGLISLELKEKA